MNKTSILVLLLLSISFFAQSGFADSCNFPKGGQCFNFGGGFSESESHSVCGKIPGGVFSISSCSSAEVAGKCKVTISGKATESVFYFPNWTINLTKERCAKMKGSFY